MKTKPKPNSYYKKLLQCALRAGGWECARDRGFGRPAPPSDLFLTNVPSRAAHTERGNDTGTQQGSGSTTSPTLRVRQLLFSAPQSPDKPVSSVLGLCVRVVAAIAARAIALFSGKHVIVGQMVAPEARSKHGSDRLNARTRSDIRALKRAKLVMFTAGGARRWIVLLRQQP